MRCYKKVVDKTSFFETKTAVWLTRVARNEMERIKIGEIVAGMNFDGLQQAHEHPYPQHHHMIAEQKDANEEPSTKHW